MPAGTGQTVAGRQSRGGTVWPLEASPHVRRSGADSWNRHRHASPVDGSTGPRNATFGDGAYFTDLAPEGIAGTTEHQLKRALFGTPWWPGSVDYYVAVDSSRVMPPPVWVGLLNSNTYPGSIYLSPSVTAVSIAGAVVRSGAVRF